MNSRVRLAVDGEFDPTLVGVALKRDVVAFEGRHEGAGEGRSVHRGPAREYGDTGGNSNGGVSDSTDVLDGAVAVSGSCSTITSSY